LPQDDLDRVATLGLRTVILVHDTVAIKQILDHLGLGEPEDTKPPPEIVQVPVDEEGRELCPSPRR
jgi:hypothetical protein